MSTRTTQVEIIVFRIQNKEIEYLLLRRAAERGGFWQPITGGVEGDEAINKASIREVEEETGITEFKRLIEDVYYFEFDSVGYGHRKEYVFGMEITPETSIKLSWEHDEMKWCSFEEALSLLKYETNKEALRRLNNMLR